MQAFTRHTGVVAALDRSNIDTDQIIPKQFLKSIQRTGFGPALFFDWRYGSDGQPDPGFPLNRPEVEGRSVLVVRNNFGCGSSREHAVWAVMQDGFRVVVAPSVGEGDRRVEAFADIFRNNSTKNGLLTVELTEAEVDEIFGIAEKTPGLKATADLESQTFTLHAPDGDRVYRFEVDPTVKHNLLHGLDDIALSLEHEAAITAFEQTHDHQLHRAG